MSCMASSPPPSPRAVGRRIEYRELPNHVASWVTCQFGPVNPVIEHLGGMSLGWQRRWPPRMTAESSSKR